MSGSGGCVHEEINRLVTDAVTTFFFTTSEVANENLRRSVVPDVRIFFVGNTMIDSLMANMGRLTPRRVGSNAPCGRATTSCSRSIGPPT